jgi:hypothetical protein
MLNAELTPASSDRVPRSLALRTAQAGNDAFAVVPLQIDNGDEALYIDKSGTYTKGILQTTIGLVDLAAYATFKAALASGNPVDFQNIVLGGGVHGRTQNGPQGGLAFYLKCRDAAQFAVPPAPALASEAYATELVELYWASLLRDVAFSDYHTNATAIAAATELSAMPTYAGPKPGGHVTPDLLFRGVGKNEDVGPYISQFLLLKTDLGALPIVQRYTTNTGVDFMKTPADFLAAQNGANPTAALTPAAQLYLHDGRGLAAYTHSDVLYQAYFVAHLVMETLRKGNPHVANPGNPYAPGQPGAATQNGFASMGGSGHCRDTGRGGGGGYQGRLVSEVVGAFAASAGVRRRHRASHEDRHGGFDSGPCQQHRAEFPGGANQPHRDQHLVAAAGLP